MADVQPDGSVIVTEKITYLFTGSFEGGYREIPLKDSMSVTDVSVGEGGREYAAGASAELGPSGTTGTYGTANLGARYRIVWHYRASDEQRTFTIRYRLEGLAVAYDDVVDVYWQAWGDEWQEPLGSLKGTVLLPRGAGKGDVVKVFGHPASVSGARWSRGWLQKIMDEEAAEARSEARQAQQTRLHELLGLLYTLLFFGFVCAVTVILVVVRVRYGWWFRRHGGGGGGGGAW